MESFSAWLKNERLKSGFGSRELSKAIGRSPNYISSLEKGTQKLPSPEIAKKICDTLNIENWDQWLIHFGILEKTDRLKVLLNVDEHERKNLIETIQNDIKGMDNNQLSSIYMMINKHHNLLDDLRMLDRLDKQAINSLKDYVRFLITQYD